MRKIRSLIVASAVLAVVGAATAAAPAAAAPGKGTIGVVNGKPGSGRVDICINGKEIRSRAKYGGRAYRVMVPNNKIIKIFRADPRKCKGKLLGKKTIALAAGDDLTVVYSPGFPKFTVFSNDLGGDIPAAPGDPLDGVALYWRHAAKLGDATFKFRVAEPEDTISPSVDPVYQLGDEYKEGIPADYAIKLRATRPDKNWSLAEAPWIVTEASKRYEWILLGTKGKNAKIIVWIRNIVEKAP